MNSQASNVIYEQIITHVRPIRLVSDQQIINQYVYVLSIDLVHDAYYHQHVQSMLVKIMVNVYQLI